MHRKKLPIILEKEEAQKLLNAPSKTCFTGRRNRTIIAVMLTCGLRVSEIINLAPTDVDLKYDRLRVLRSKRDKDRWLAIPTILWDQLNEWDKERPRSDWYFPTMIGGPLCRRYIEQAIGRYAKKAGIGKNVTPHTLRHTYATEFYRQTHDIETLRRILGHESITTTTIYLTLANEDVQQRMKDFRGYGSAV